MKVQQTDRFVGDQIRPGQNSFFNTTVRKQGWLQCKLIQLNGSKLIFRSWKSVWVVLHDGHVFLCTIRSQNSLCPFDKTLFPINLTNFDISASSINTKKQCVFRLTSQRYTAEHTELLLQADNIQAMCEWIHEMRRGSKGHIPSSPPQSEHTASSLHRHFSNYKFRKSLRRTFRRESYNINAEPASTAFSHDDIELTRKNSLEMSRNIQKGFGRTFRKDVNEVNKVTQIIARDSIHLNFGIEIERCEVLPTLKYVPAVVQILTRIIEKRGLCNLGLYRQTGSMQTVAWMIDQLDKGIFQVDFANEKWCDVRATASTLKTFFVRMPECLFGEDVYETLMEASRIEDECLRFRAIRSVTVRLSEHRLQTLIYLLAHFSRVVAMCQYNKTDARNISIIFGPTLLWHRHIPVYQNLVDNPVKIQLLESLIDYRKHLCGAGWQEENKDDSSSSEKLTTLSCDEYLKKMRSPQKIAEELLFADKHKKKSQRRSNEEVKEQNPDAPLVFSLKRKGKLVFREFCSVGENASSKGPVAPLQIASYCGNVDVSSDVQLGRDVEKKFSVKSSNTGQLMQQGISRGRKSSISAYTRFSEYGTRDKPARKSESLKTQNRTKASQHSQQSSFCVRRRHTFSTAVEILAQGAKHSGKWWIAKVNSFKATEKKDERF